MNTFTITANLTKDPVVRWEVYLSQFTFCDKAKKQANPDEQETA